MTDWFQQHAAQHFPDFRTEYPRDRQVCVIVQNSMDHKIGWTQDVCRHKGLLGFAWFRFFRSNEGGVWRLAYAHIVPSGEEAKDRALGSIQYWQKK